MYPLAFTRRDGVQCPFCVWKSSRRAPTCVEHESLMTPAMIPEVNELINKYNTKEISREAVNASLEILMSPASGNMLVGCRVLVDYDGSDEFPQGIYKGTAVEYNTTTREYLIEYDSGYGLESMNVFSMYDYAIPAYKEFIYEFIKSFTDVYSKDDAMYTAAMNKFVSLM